jgi:probable F420-dependent oxidoreductase
MEIGLTMMPAEGGMAPDRLATEVEARGFESLFVGEHTHLPKSRPYTGEGSLPRAYYHTLDPFLFLTAAAAGSAQLRLGTSICLVVQRDPILLAKEVATLDTLSEGRFVFGVGAGWNVEEIANHGVDPAMRGALFCDRLRAMDAIWRDEYPEYHGRFVDFDAIYSWPKPAQQPRPPVLIGGSGERVIDRVLELADGWIPMAWDLPSLAPRIAELRARAADAARSVDITACAVIPTDENMDLALELGVDRALLQLESAPADDTLRQLDELTPWLDHIR